MFISLKMVGISEPFISIHGVFHLKKSVMKYIYC